MVNYVLAGAARTQAAAMIQELETARPGAAERLAHGALAELRTWPELTVLEVDENLTEQGCSVAGAYDSRPATAPVRRQIRQPRTTGLHRPARIGPPPAEEHRRPHGALR